MTNAQAERTIICQHSYWVYITSLYLAQKLHHYPAVASKSAAPPPDTTDLRTTEPLLQLYWIAKLTKANTTCVL